MQPLIARFRSARYAPMICLALALISLAFLEVSITWLNFRGRYAWQVISGSLLLTLLLYQWVLFFKRAFSGMRLGAGDLVTHRWVGVASTYLFALHAVRMGHFWMTALSLCFFLLALTGVLTRQVLGFRQNWLYLLWLTVHIGLAAAMIPLIAVHIWVALAFE